MANELGLVVDLDELSNFCDPWWCTSGANHLATKRLSPQLANQGEKTNLPRSKHLEMGLTFDDIEINLMSQQAAAAALSQSIVHSDWTAKWPQPSGEGGLVVLRNSCQNVLSNWCFWWKVGFTASKFDWFLTSRSLLRFCLKSGQLVIGKLPPPSKISVSVQLTLCYLS